MRVLFAAFAVCAFLVPGGASADALLSDSPEWIALRKQIDVLESKIQASKDNPSAFNPGITVFGNVMGCFSRAQAEADDHHHEGEDHGHEHHHHHDHDAHDHGSECSNQFLLRELELDFRAAIGPYADGVVIIALEQESAGAFSAEIEEGYVLLKPGFQLKLGRFLSSFGRINRIHTHDLPQMTSPLASGHFLGGHGLAQDGASAEVMVPTPGESNALTLNLEVLFGKSLPLSDTKNNLPKFVGRLSWFFDLGQGHDLDLGASTLLQPGSNGKPLFQLYGADFNYRWRPFLQGDRQSFLFGGEMFVANGTGNPNFDKLPIGGFLWTQYQFNQNVYLGLRYSYDQGTTKENLLNTSAGVFLTYYTTEFLRFRVGYDRVSNNANFADGRDLFMVELNFIFGSHPSEPYWVNR